MNAGSLLLLALMAATVCALAYGAATVLVKLLSRPWRQAAETHWSERARLAFAPGFAALLLIAVLPGVMGLVGEVGLGIINPRLQKGMDGFWIAALAALAGVMTVRYQWLRRLWGARVTLRSWLGGCLVLLLLLVPHLLLVVLLLFLMPDIPNARAGMTFGAGVIAVAFFACGGGMMLLRLIGVVRPAPPAVTELVRQLARDMKVAGRIKVFQMEWAQVNALAFVLYRAVGFSRPLLDVMTSEELRAVAAHELAHLAEPGRVRVVRVAHMFAYLPLVPLAKYGGFQGVLGAYGLFVVMMFAFRRFTHRLEQRADRLECEAILDPNAYMRSLIKLHEANLIPAVMPGSQTHPHLYDRLLAGRIQPDFPRPMAPSRVKPLLAVLIATLITTILASLVVIACGVVLRVAASFPKG